MEHPNKSHHICIQKGSAVQLNWCQAAGETGPIPRLQVISKLKWRNGGLNLQCLVQPFQERPHVSCILWGYPNCSKEFKWLFKKTLIFWLFSFFAFPLGSSGSALLQPWAVGFLPQINKLGPKTRWNFVEAVALRSNPAFISIPVPGYKKNFIGSIKAPSSLLFLIISGRSRDITWLYRAIKNWQF